MAFEFGLCECLLKYLIVWSQICPNNINNTLLSEDNESGVSFFHNLKNCRCCLGNKLTRRTELRFLSELEHAVKILFPKKTCYHSIQTFKIGLFRLNIGLFEFISLMNL